MALERSLNSLTKKPAGRVGSKRLFVCVAIHQGIFGTHRNDAVFSAAIAADKMQLLSNQLNLIVKSIERQEIAIILRSALTEAYDGDE